MKALKKLTAIVLAVCMLIGMPLSIDVSAVKSSDPVTTLEMLQVMPYIADPRYADVVPTNENNDPARHMFVIFNSNTNNNGKAGSDILVVDKDGKLIKDENNTEVILRGSFQGGLMPAGGLKPLAWRLNAGQSYSNKTINNFFDVKALLESEYYATKGAKLLFRAWETSVEAGDGKIADYYCYHDGSILLSGTEVLTIGGVQRDGVTKEVVWSPVTLTKVQALNDTRVVLHFSEPINQNADKNNIYIAARIVDTTNNYALKYDGSTPQQWPLASGGWSYSGENLTGNLSKPISEIQAICDGFNAAENTDKYKVMFCLEEMALSEVHGENRGNGYVDTMWGKISGAPLSASTMPAANIYDGAYCEITTAEELKNANMTIKGVYPVSRLGLADKIVVEFSDPVNEIKGTSWIRAFGSDDALLTHDSNTMKLTSVDSGHLQWQVNAWTKANTEGTLWIGNLNAAYDCDTYADIVDYLSRVTDDQDNAITPANGYKLQLAFLDNSGDKVSATGLIEGIKSADGTKMLYAANVQNLGEERAVCEVSASLSVTDVEIYADEYVIMTFSDDIDIDVALATVGNENKFYMGAHKNPANADDPVKDTGHIQASLTNARKFGNATNKLLFDLSGGWNAFKARVDAYEAANSAVEVYVRIEANSGAYAAIVPGITSADGSLKLYRSNPASWGGRMMIPTELIPAVTVTNVKADTDKNMLIVSFSEPVKYTAQQVELKKSSGGTYTAMRSQVSVQRFKTADMTLDTQKLYQVAATAYTASDASGNAVTDEYSTFWAFTFPEGAVEAAANYYAEGNTAYTDEIGYGFGVFEARAGNGNDQIADLSMGLPLTTYMDDFATAPDANGNVKYLKASSTSSGCRFFKAVSVDPSEAPSLITVTEAKLTSASTVQITFSEQVLIGADGYNSIRVTEKSNLVGPDNADYQMGGKLTAVNPDGEGYAAVWTFTVNEKTIGTTKYNTITQWAQKYFFNNDYSVTDGVTLCMSFQSNKGLSGDGMTDYITGKNGGVLAASPYDHGQEGTYVNIGEDPMFFTDQIIQKVELIGDTDALVTVTPIQSYGGTKSWRIIDGATDEIKVIDGTPAVWKIVTWTNYLNGNKQMIVSGMAETLGVKTFDGIRGKMDADDKLVLAFSDTRLNGVIDDFFLAGNGGYKIQKALKTATEDVAYFEVDTNVTREALSVTDISVYERSLQTYAQQDRYLIFTFSHEISDEMLNNIRSEQVQFWMTVKEVGGNKWWYDKNDGNGYILNTSTPYHARIAATNFQRYGNTGNKLIAAVSGGTYKGLTDRVADINDQKGGNVAELVVRMETTGKLSGFAGVNTLLTPADANVLPIVLDEAWSGGGRVYTPAFNDGRKIQVGAIELIDDNTAEITFTDESDTPAIITNTLYNPNATAPVANGGVYVAIRLTKDGKLAWSNKAMINTSNQGSPLQFNATLTTKNGTTADSTWVLTCNGLADLIQAMNDENGYLRKNGLDMAFGLEGGDVSGTGNLADYIDAFTTTDGKGILQMIKGDTSLDQASRYFYSYLNHPDAWITNGLVADTVKIAKVEAINNATLQVTFDRAVNVGTSGNYFRIVDETNNLIRFDSDQVTPLGNIMNVGEKDAAGSTAGLAHVAAKVTKADADGKVWNFALNGGRFGNFGFADFVEFTSGLPTSGNWNGSLHFGLILEENGAGVMSNNGLSDHVVATDGSGAKLVNTHMGNGIGDGTCIDITADMVVDYTSGVEVVSAKQINKNQILVKFSEGITMGTNPYFAIRLVDGNDELIWSARNANGETIRGNYNQGSPMQWSASKKEQIADDELLLTFKGDVSVILDGSNLPACLSPTTNPDYQYKLVIEETDPINDGEAITSGFVCDVVSKNDPTKMLVSTTKHVAGHTTWDGNATVIEAMTAETLITVSDAKISGENEVSFEWSHSVDLTNSSTYYAAFRYVNEDTNVLYGNDKDGWMQMSAYLEYTDSAMCKMTAHVYPTAKWNVYDIDDLLNPTGELKEYMDAHPGKWILRIEEMGGGKGNGTIDTYFGKDGTTILADPFTGSWADGVDMDITGKTITGELSVTNVELISDTNVKVTFSAPVAYAKVDGKESKPYVAMRLYNAENKLLFWNPYTEEYTTVESMKDKDGKQIYKNQNGYTLEKEGYDAKGEWVPYAAQKNQAMQWSSSNAVFGDDAHTTIIYTLGGGAQLPIQNMTDLLNYDFSAFGEGCYVGFDIEENTPAMKPHSGHVDNIVRKDNSKIALDANFFPHLRDSVMITLDNIKISYKPYKINSTTRIISDTQIRVSFSEPVQIPSNPFMAIRMIDKEGNLMWSGAENISAPYQWTGSWEWEDDTHKSIIWTMNPGIMGGNSIYELANWVGPLGKYKNEGTWMFVIEELDNTKNNFIVGRFNNLVDNVLSLDGTVHLSSTYSKGYDGILTKLNTEDLVGPEIELLSAKAIDDQTIELTFTEAVNMDENISLGVRYLSPSGDSEVLTDGKVAYFKGDWEYKDDSKTVIVWKLNSKSADNLTDIINYNGKFEWNKGARVAFVIMDEEGNRANPKAMKINGVYDLVNGFRRLKANYATEDYPMTQLDIEVLYDIPAPEASGDAPLSEIVYVTNYIPFIIASAVIVVAGLVVAIILYKKRKKNEQ